MSDRERPTDEENSNEGAEQVGAEPQVTKHLEERLKGAEVVWNPSVGSDPPADPFQDLTPSQNPDGQPANPSDAAPVSDSPSSVDVGGETETEEST